MRRALLLSLSLVAACSGGGASPPSASVQADVAALQELLGSDPARTVLREIEAAVDSERPVMAAQMIDSAGAPAVRRQIDRLQAAEVSTPEGRRLRSRSVRVFRGRLEALERYGALLARGVGTEDRELLDAMHAYADAELQVVALHDDLALLRPLAEGAEQAGPAERDPRLGGLPRLRRDEPSGDDEPALPEGEPDRAAGEPAEPLPE